jgi:hypothetical protein
MPSSAAAAAAADPEMLSSAQLQHSNAKNALKTLPKAVCRAL